MDESIEHLHKNTTPKLKNDRLRELTFYIQDFDNEQNILFAVIGNNSIQVGENSGFTLKLASLILSLTIMIIP